MLTLREAEAWANLHGTVVQTQRMAVPTNLDATGIRPAIDAWRLGLDALRELVQRAELSGASLVPIGSGWSLSRALAVDGTGWLVDTKHLKEVPFVGLRAEHFHVGTGIDPGHLVFAQSGNTVARMHDALAGLGLSLPTSGASCGQTLAGAISTGTHGAAIAYGGLADMVRGVSMVLTGGEHVWIEPSNRRVTSDAWPTHLGARAVRDDDAFHSAVVSFGAMGLVHGYLLEVEPMFRIQRYYRTASLRTLKGGIRRLGRTLLLDLPAKLLPGGAAAVHHVDVGIDPNDPDQCVLSIGYSAGPAPGYVPVIKPAAQPKVGDDAIIDITRLIALVGPLSNARVRKEVRKLLDERTSTGEDEPAAALCELFPQIRFPTGGHSTEIGVDVDDWPRALDVVLKAIGGGTVPGIMSVRFVRGSEHLLTITRFPVTCTIELPTVNSPRTLRMFGRIWRGLHEAGITHTLHWGQACGFNDAPVEVMYGRDAVRRWRAAREGLLGPVGMKIFRNRLRGESGLEMK